MPIKEGPVPPFPVGADPDEYDRLRRFHDALASSAVERIR